MRLRKWWLVFVLVALSLVTVSCANEQSRAPMVPFATESIHNQRSQYTSYGDSPFVVVYVLDRATGLVVPVSVIREPSETPLEQTVRLLNAGSLPQSLRPLGASQSRIQGLTLGDSLLTVEMPPAFQSWVTRNLAEERAFVKAAALTFTSFQDIRAVQFRINGLPMHGAVGPFQLAQTLSRPMAVNSLLADSNSLVLYLRLRDSDLLVPWAIPSARREPAVALHELARFRGHERLVSPVPASLSVQSVRVETGLAIVNLDKASVSLFLQGTTNQQLVLDALVYTLLEFPDIKEVLFLVDGRVLGPLGSNVDLSRPIGRTAINRLPTP
ncbi:MAG: hypothetical protein DDT39_01184 [Firmicutes bacterium]|nr:hypothetical protein [candidate division NPL-UPA2 bacterium]MBT9154507.1 hypothetical protein [candidate division NPL-UPA2 bacterium]